jgi:hypothetical protein
VSQDALKRLIIAATNMEALPPNLPEPVSKFLKLIKDDCKLIIDFEKSRSPELMHHYRLLPNGSLCFMALLDHHREALVINKIDQQTSSNEYDGVVEFVESWEDVQRVHDTHAAAVAPLQLTMKPYGPVLELGKSKRPDLQWDKKCGELDGVAWLAKWRQCMQALFKGPAKCRAIDTVFGAVVRCSCSINIRKTGGGRFELFQNGFWRKDCDGRELKEFVAAELLALFHYSEGTAHPREPLQEDAFVSKVVTCVLDYMPHIREYDMDALDNKSHLKLLDSEGMLYDWANSTFRKQQAEDRLYRKMPRPFAFLPDSEQEKVNSFCEELKMYFKAGGKSLQSPDEEDADDFTENPTLRDRRLALAATFDNFLTNDHHLLIKALWNIFENRDEVIFLLRVFSRTLSGTIAFAELYALTGPPSGGKSFVVMLLNTFLGQGNAHLVAPLPANYFTSPPRDDAEASKAILSSCQGAKMITPKEQPAKAVNPTSIKMLLDGKDTNVSGRANHSLRSEESSFPITWTIFMQSQGSISTSFNENDTGLEGKIVELQPPFQFCDQESYDRTNTRHRLGDRSMAEKCLAGDFNAALFTWSMGMFTTLSSDICTNRNIIPWPASALTAQQEALGDTLKVKVLSWMQDSLEACPRQEASDFKDVKRACAAFFACQGSKIDESMFTAVGLGLRAKNDCRVNGARKTYFLVKLRGQTDRQPVRLRNAATSSAPNADTSSAPDADTSSAPNAGTSSDASSSNQ